MKSPPDVSSATQTRPPESRDLFCLAARQATMQADDVSGWPASPLWRSRVEVVVTHLAGATTVGPCVASDNGHSALGLGAHFALRDRDCDIRNVG